jgi:ABC-type multidrug transport system fused ATPase/permease subunit
MLYKSIKNKQLTNKRSVSLVIIILVYFTLCIELSSEINKPLITISVLSLYDKYFKKININNKNNKNFLKIYNIRFEHVYFKYPETRHMTLKDLSIEFKPKKINVIFGRSGFGKTTIMKLIISLYKPTSGMIYMNNVNINTLSFDEIINSIYYVNQKTVLFNYPIIDNMIYGNNSTKKNAILLLKKYNLNIYFNGLEKSIYTNSGVNGSNLSLGMQKIVMIVRGILQKNKSVIIFDEPLTSLDKQTKQKIIKMIIEETKGKTIIIISHDDDILPHAQNIIKLK